MPQHAQLILGKFPVIRRDIGSFTIALGGTTEMQVKMDFKQARSFDIRIGDLLTVYTDVLYKSEGK